MEECPKRHQGVARLSALLSALLFQTKAQRQIDEVPGPAV